LRLSCRLGFLRAARRGRGRGRRRPRRLASRFLNGDTLDFLFRRLFDRRDSGPFVHHHFSSGPAFDRAGFRANIINHLGLINNGRVVDDDRARANRFVEPAGFDEDEVSGCDDEAARSDRGPAAITTAITPSDPSRRPFDPGNPQPPMPGIVDPTSIVVTRPGPRLIARPIPSAVGPHPMANRIGAPLDRHTGGTPAPPVGAKLDPRPMRCQRSFKFRRRPNRNFCRHLQIGSDATGEHQR
jgi:hypothetical protein